VVCAACGDEVGPGDLKFHAGYTTATVGEALADSSAT
jgi:hypothetical protein